ncbi:MULTISPECIES: 5-(carboxyamino)imidazole ribonucleotide synthase [unclassified Crossiella]|uniref:5-(carboxyamino)imidazole ribonucleotide synthase n=1 Tax=unclassified Crossiella TaxID=2620835 RepID=UPI001FFEFD81|nr:MULTISPECIES: 5-(carboxyamino)imidazole ribonucleotide synthase [unclassified Crossiella]MCK2238391.1 5-(carboxyamino)imidazole ribonucleotide synthase [Crossiella sp. S99.2]MCK2256431.1 5-(carboxyamino)imidazole ribonucleotide synthase [Crossiella sp. S99.1]
MDPRTGTPVVGMVGGGQLARMTHQAAIALGQSLRVLAVSEADPAALVARDVQIGTHTDLEALRRFAKGCEVLTFDHEHVPAEHLHALVAEDVTVHPGPDALIYAQDKLKMRVKLRELDVPVPPFTEVTEVAQVLRFGAEHGWPCVLKAVRGGYDGRGVWMLNTPQSAERTVPELLAAGTPLMVEQCVPMRRELAALIARSPFGQGAAWPVVQTVQSDGICVEVLAPAPDLSEALAQQAQELALRIAAELGVVGVLAVELFETADGVLVNELAMRPHNSGHWTMDGAGTSQFEQHVRAVLDYPLGLTDLKAPAVVMANVLGAPAPPKMGVDERIHHLFARFPEARVHLYGKAERPGRKVGHVNVLGQDLAETRRRATLAAHWLAHGEWTDGYDVHGGN